VREGMNLQIRAEGSISLNHTNLGTPNAIVFANESVESAFSTAGLITPLPPHSARKIQPFAKLIF